VPDAGEGPRNQDPRVKQVTYPVKLIVGANVLEAEAVNVLGRARSPRVSVTIEREGG